MIFFRLYGFYRRGGSSITHSLRRVIANLTRTL